MNAKTPTKETVELYLAEHFQLHDGTWPFRRKCTVDAPFVDGQEHGIWRKDSAGCTYWLRCHLCQGRTWLPDCDDWERLEAAAHARGWVVDIHSASMLKGDEVTIKTGTHTWVIERKDNLTGYPAIQWALAQAAGMKREEE